MEKENHDRRGFFSKIAKLGLASGIGALLLGRIGEKTFVPPVHAADMVIDGNNVGSGTTELTSSGSDSAFKVISTATSGDTEGIHVRASSPDGEAIEACNIAVTGVAMGVYGYSDSTSGRGVEGFANALTGYSVGVRGVTKSPNGKGVEGYSSALSGLSRGVYGSTISPEGVGVEGHADDPGATPLVARGDSGQTANLQEWQSDDETALTVVDKDGKLGIGTSDPRPMLDIVSGTTGPLNAASSPPGSAPNSFIAENLTGGNHKSQFTFRSNGLNKWSFGNDVSGTGGQDFFIWDEVAAQSRIFIDSSGNIGINTLSPTEMLDVPGNVKAQSFITGDVVFSNGYKLTEDQESGMLLINQKGEKIAKFDEEGNLHIKGDIIKDL